MTDNSLTVAETLPQRINVTKVVSYDVAEIVRSLHEVGGLEEGKTPTIEDIIWLIEDWAKDDFNQKTLDDLIFQDENGEDL